jgi:hypothetical protein
MRAPTLVRGMVILLTGLTGGMLMQSRTVSHAMAGQLKSDLRHQRSAGPVCADPFAADLPAEARPLFVVQGGTAAQVAQEFVQFLQQHGIEAELYEEVFIQVRYNNEALLLDVRVNRGGLSRIIVAKAFDVVPEYRHTLALTAYLLRLNQTFDFAQFYLSPQADRLIVQGSLTFVDHLEAQEVRTFLDFFHRGLVRIGDVLPETTQLLH